MSDNASNFSVERYSPQRKAAWDAFLGEAKNATFLFRRDYMDYHSDRFADHSLMIFCEDELAAVLPANLAAENTLISHQGLTYGGLVVSRRATLKDVLDCFQAGLRYLQEEKIDKVLYKQFPSFYNTLPDDEVAYALFLLEAQLRRRDCALVVKMSERFPLRKGRKSEISKGRRFGLRVVQETSFVPFWERVLVPRLANRYGVKPVHSVEEITLLASRFPDNIKQYSVYHGEDIVAGTTIYETGDVAHAQYLSVSDQGQEFGALDFLFGWLLDETYKAKSCFSFGICNENEGRSLNHGLLEWKEGFGGRSCAHDFYDVSTQNHVKLGAVLQRKEETRVEAVREPGTPDLQTATKT